MSNSCFLAIAGMIFHKFASVIKGQEFKIKNFR